MIDRVWHGYVVDMLDISPLFEYPVFNLADCFVVVGAVLGAVYYLWFYDKYDKRSAAMDARTLTATTESAGTRLDAFLAVQLPGLTRSAAARLIEGGFVTVDGRPAGKSVRLVGGETVSVTLPEAEEPEARPEDIPLDVVYEDGDVIVVNKPVGMVVHPAPGHPDGTLVNALLHHCAGSLSGIGGQLRPGIVHRIDRDTSGLIIAAKNRRRPRLPGRPAGRPHPGPDLRVPGSGQFQGGQRHRGCTHRPPPDGPEKKWPWSPMDAGP